MGDDDVVPGGSVEVDAVQADRVSPDRLQIGELVEQGIGDRLAGIDHDRIGPVRDLDELGGGQWHALRDLDVQVGEFGGVLLLPGHVVLVERRHDAVTPGHLVLLDWYGEPGGGHKEQSRQASLPNLP